MNKFTAGDAENLLKKYSSGEEAFNKVLSHSRAVKELALKMASRVKGVDMDFIDTASILHDIGRFECPPGPKTIFHGVKGSEILKKEHLPRHALVAERHVGSGITKDEARKLGLPTRSYLPKSKEEKIICMADSLIFGDKPGTFEQVLERYKKEVGKALVRRTLRLYREIQRMQR
jgi:uncharacterized protein (TIGR00295 family)